MATKNLPEWSNRQVVLATLFAVAVSLGFWLVYRFRLVVFTFFVAIVLGTAIRPAVQWLHRRGIPRPAGVIVLYLLIFLALTSFMVLMFPLIVGQFTQIAINVPEYYQSLRGAMIDSPSRLLRIMGFQLPQQLFSLLQPKQPGGETLDRVTQTLQITGLITRSLFITVAVFLLGFYWTLESERVIRTA